LLAHAKLTNNQRLGIEHYDDLLQRIPREEVTALADIVRAASATVDSEVEVTIGGSYRRGAATSGDLDCLMTKPCTKSSNELLYFLHNLVMRLTDSGFLVAPLAQPSKRDSSGSKWHGCCVLPGSPKPIWRRIDLLLVPETELGAALIYFTGDDIFNRSIRLLAGRKYNRSLNQRGLYKNVMRGPGRVKLNDGELEEAADEKKIFAILGVPWRPPEQRICH
jgi:DNA polymerase IV